MTLKEKAFRHHRNIVVISASVLILLPYLFGASDTIMVLGQIITACIVLILAAHPVYRNKEEE